MADQDLLLLQIPMGLFLGLSIVFWAESIRTFINQKEPHMDTITVQTGALDLVYRDENGDLHTQSWDDLTESGTLIDPESGEDMELVGWSIPA